jgi:uncharacterized iron-regulated membrane protein
MRKVFKKIHLWLSVPFGIIITLICLSGATLVFETEITEAYDHSTYFVENVGEKALPLDQLMEAVATTLPDSVQITGVTVSNNPERAYQVNLSKPRRASVYVDQYTGKITGKAQRLPFFDKMFRLHRWLLGSAGQDGHIGVGKLLVGIATLLLVVILITGLIIWLSNRKKPLTQSLKICVTKGWPRFWHDLHVAGGIYATIFLLACALTGLTWSFAWYRTGFYGMLGVEQVADNHGGEKRGGEGRGEGRGEGHGREAAAQSAEAKHWHGEHGRGEHERGAHGDFHQHDRAMGGEQHDSIAEAHAHFHVDKPVSAYATWQQAMDNVAERCPDYQQITVSSGSVGVVPQGRRSMRATDNYTINDADGSIADVKLYADQDKATKVRGVIYNIHVGNWLGLFSRILTMLAALLGATLPITGYYIWIKHLRRKHTK